MTPLPKLGASHVVCISVEGPERDASRIKRLGICKGQRIEVESFGDPMILNVVGTRIGISRRLAENIWVDEAKAPANQ